VLTNSSNSTPATATYVYTITVGPCTNTQNITVIVNPTPILTSSLTPPGICSGSTFAYTPTSSVTSGSTFAWTRAAIAGNAANSGTGNVSEVLVNNTCAPITVPYIYTVTANGCTSTQTVNVVVNPTPTFCAAFTPFAVCTGSPVNFTPTTGTSGATISWTRLVPVTGITPSTNSGSGNISETLTNSTTTTKVVTYTYTINLGGCLNTQTLVVSVDPMPVLPTVTAASFVCASANLPISTSPSTPLRWELANPVLSGVSLIPVSGTSAPTATFTAGTTLGVQQIVYTLSNACGTKTGVVTVTVGIPAITATATSVCPGSTVNLSEIVGTGTWAVMSGAGTLSPSSGTATVLTATNTAPGTAASTIVVRFTKGGCFVDITVAVYAKPQITGPTPFGICRGGNVTYIATPAAGTWSINPSSSNATIVSATGVFDATLTPNTNVNVTVLYTAPAASGSCTVNQVVAIKANPTMTGTLKVCEGLCTDIAPAVPLAGLPAGGTFSITPSTPVYATVGATTGKVCGITTTGTSTFVDVYYTFTYSSPTLSCSVSKQLTVNPLPAFLAPVPASVCEAADAIFAVNSEPAGAVTWTYVASPGTLANFNNPSNVGIYHSVNAKGGTSPGNLTVTFKNNVSGCIATTPLTVNPLPNPGTGVTITPTPYCVTNDVVTFTAAGTTSSGVWTVAYTGGVAPAYSLGNPGSVTTNSGTFTESPWAIRPPYIKGRTFTFTVTNSCGSKEKHASAVVGVCNHKALPGNLQKAADVSTVVAENGGLKVYPNPNEGSFTINLISDKNETMKVVITNILGQKVKEFTTTTNSVNDVKIAHIPGMYLISAMTAHGIFSEKVTLK